MTPSPVTDQATFDALYVASRDPRILALKTQDTTSAYAAAMALQEAGVVINEGVDLNGESAYFYMRDLASMGMVWHEALGQMPPANLNDYRDATKAYKYSVPISLDPSAYPSFDSVPAPVQPSPIGGPGGTPGTYSWGPGFYENGIPQYKEGQASTPFTAPDGETLFAHWGPTPFGNLMPSWETASAKAARIAAGG